MPAFVAIRGAPGRAARQTREYVPIASRGTQQCTRAPSPAAFRTRTAPEPALRSFVARIRQATTRLIVKGCGHAARYLRASAVGVAGAVPLREAATVPHR